MAVVYVLDDHFEIPDEIKKMSDEERHQLARKLEEEDMLLIIYVISIFYSC